MKFRKLLFLGALIVSSLFLSACGTPDEVKKAEPEPLSVKTQTVAASQRVSQSLSYPGLVSADSEATIIAKTAGNLTAVKMKVGDKVTLGQELAKIDDVGSGPANSSAFSANQIKQAQIAVSSAEAAYNLAKQNYNNILISSVKDLKAAEIARDQAAKSESNLGVTTSESVKSAELAYETARLATQQAATSLANREKLAQQTAADTRTNAGLTASSVAATAGGIVTNINNFTGFDTSNNVSISYRSNLGALDSSTFDAAKQSYQRAKEMYVSYQAREKGTVEEEVDAAIELVTAAKEAADDAKKLLDKTTTSVNLPQSSPTGTSLSGLQAAVSGYQTQINSALGQINSVKQALASVELNNNTVLDGLRQALSIAKQQEESAKQNLTNLKSGNTSQKNQASFASSLAQNQFDNAKVKIETQVAAAKTQVDTAQLQYNNALVALDSLYDAHSIISPLDGTVTKIFVAEGQSVGPGQAVVTVSKTQDIKVQFYLESTNLEDVKPGVPALVVDSSGKEYTGAVSAVSPQADPVTRRFLAEVKLPDSSGLLLGTVVDVSVQSSTIARGEGSMILPLEAITVGQNGSHIFIIEDGKAKRIEVEVKEVKGELARVQANLGPETAVIVSGNRRVEDGQAVQSEELTEKN